jgi:hypothetical protein
MPDPGPGFRNRRPFRGTDGVRPHDDVEDRLLGRRRTEVVLVAPTPTTWVRSPPTPGSCHGGCGHTREFGEPVLLHARLGLGRTDLEDA